MTRDDEPLPEDEAISAAHPMRTGRHELYGEAMRLVGARHSKGALVDLVNWLLTDRDEARSVARTSVAAVKAYSEELIGKPTSHTFDRIVAGWPAVPYQEPAQPPGVPRGPGGEP